MGSGFGLGQKPHLKMPKIGRIVRRTNCHGLPAWLRGGDPVESAGIQSESLGDTEPEGRRALGVWFCNMGIGYPKS
jgi:hypothetical protein